MAFGRRCDAVNGSRCGALDGAPGAPKLGRVCISHAGQSGTDETLDPLDPVDPVENLEVAEFGWLGGAIRGCSSDRPQTAPSLTRFDSEAELGAQRIG